MSELARTPYSLTSPGRPLAMTFLYAPSEETAARLVSEYARVIQSTLHLRARDELPALLAPWDIVSSRRVQHYAREGDSLAAEPQDGGLEMHGLFALHR